MRKVTVELKVVLDIEMKDTFEVDTDEVVKVLSEMDYGFKAGKGAAGEIVESEIIDWEIKDQ